MQVRLFNRLAVDRHTATWWHNSPGYVSIDVQQLLLGISAANTLILEGHATVWQFTT